jgi:hypothetical protein
MTDDAMIAPCGIDCAQCEIYKATNDPQLAEQTAKRWRETWAPKADASWFVCQGCRADRTLCWTDDCKIYPCCVEQHGLNSCSQCDEFPCATLEAWATDPSHAAQFERLKEMRTEK